MKKGKICSKLKKMLITIMCVVTLVFSMPMKAKANIIEDFIDLLLRIPDGIMWVGNWWIADRDTKDSMAQIGLKGVHGGPWGKDDDGYIYNFFVTPYDIFTAGETREYLDLYGDKHVYRNLPIFSANFFNIDDNIVAENDATALKSNEVLRPVIGNIYKYLRNLAIVLMMLVLLYIGIKIIISSAASDQSKYKKMLMDWLVGLCLLFIMHYIMSFIMNINDIVVKMLSNGESSSYYISFGAMGDSAVASNGVGEEWYEFFDDYNDKAFISLHLELKGTASSGERWQSIEPSDPEFDFNSNDATIQLNTHTDWGDNGLVKINARITGDSRNDVCVYRGNLVEYIRTLMSYSQSFVTIYANNTNSGKVTTEDQSDSDTMAKMGYGILYLALVVETVMFCVIYFKRVLQLAFLTMIAPLVAFMYPLDKVGDGSAQSFNGWLKDYIFNALLQPLHLLLYTIFITAAMDLFSKNIIYALAVYAFMIPAEKYFKKIFGFDKASGSPPGGMAGALGGVMAMRGLDKLTGLGPHGHGKGGGAGDKGDKGIKINRTKLPKKDDSASGAGSSGVGGGASTGSGSTNRGAGTRTGAGTGSGGTGTGGNPSPTAGQNKKDGWLRKGGRALKNTGLSTGKTLGRRITRAATGGKYSNPTAKGAIKAAIGNGAKKGLKLGTKGLGTVALGGVGLMAGAATAIATGDSSNLMKGVSVGALAGLNKGGQFADWAEGVGEEAKLHRASMDEGYRNKYFQEQARQQFQDEALDEKQEAALEAMSPYVDLKGDVDRLDSYVAAKDELFAGKDFDELSLEELDELDKSVKDAQRYGELTDKNNLETFRTAKFDDIKANVDMSQVSISDDQIREQAKINKQAELDANKAEQDKLQGEMFSRIKNARDTGHDVTADNLEKEYKDKMTALKNKKAVIMARDVNSDSAKEAARNQLMEQERDRLAEIEFAKKVKQQQKVYDKARKIKS